MTDYIEQKISFKMIKMELALLRRYFTPDQQLAYLKIINNYMKNNICISQQIFHPSIVNPIKIIPLHKRQTGNLPCWV